jgi:hypothetical protein
MRYSSRFFLYAPFSLFVLFALGTMIWWWLAASALDKRLNAVNGHEIAPGVRVSFASKSVDGFPFRLDTLFRNLRVQFPGTHGPASWQAENFVSHALLYNSNQAILEAAGRQTLTWTGESGAQHMAQFTPASLHADVLGDGTTLTRFDLDIVGLALPDFSAGRAQFHIRRDPASDVLDVALSGDDVRLKAPEPPQLGSRILHLELDGHLSSADEFAPLLSGHGQWRAIMERWRKHGVVAVDRVALKWGKLSLDGAGALALDDQRRLKGLVYLKVEGYESMFGAMGASEQGFGAALVDIVSNGDKPVDSALPVTLAVKDGVAFVGSIPADTIDPLY